MSPAANSPTPASARRLVLVGANPAVQLFHGDLPTAYVSCWRVDWSMMGRGTALVLWRPAGVDLFGSDLRLATWLAERFVRHFPELDGLPWGELRLHQGQVHVDVDLAHGSRAEAESVRVEISQVLGRGVIATDDFRLGDVDHSLSMVLAPCAEATIELDGRPLSGVVERGGTPEHPGSSAFTTEAEVWRA